MFTTISVRACEAKGFTCERPFFLGGLAWME